MPKNYFFFLLLFFEINGTSVMKIYLFQWLTEINLKKTSKLNLKIGNSDLIMRLSFLAKTFHEFTLKMQTSIFYTTSAFS